MIINARSVFTVKFQPYDSDGATPLGFGNYTVGSDIDGTTSSLRSFIHILNDTDSVKILSSSTTTFTTSADHKRAAGDWVVIRDHVGRTINNTAYQIATVPTARTFTIASLVSGSGTGGKIYPVMVSDDGVVLKSAWFQLSDAANGIAIYTVNKGLAQVTEEKHIIAECWYEISGGIQLNDLKEFDLAPSYGPSPY